MDVSSKNKRTSKKISITKHRPKKLTYFIRHN